jgi:hypothetical protein
VYTPAVPEDHAELVFYREHGYKVVKRSDVLQQITSDYIQHLYCRYAWKDYYQHHDGTHTSK